MSGAGARSSSSVGTRDRTSACTRASGGDVASGASRSIAWHAHRISIAITSRARPTRALGLQRGGHAHADVVLLVRGGRNRVDAGRVRQRLQLRGDRRGRHLRQHVARTCSPPSRVRNAGSPLSAGSTSRSVRRSLIVASGTIAAASRSAAMAIGAPWKLPPDDDVAGCRRTPSGCRWRCWPRSRPSRARTAAPRAPRRAPGRRSAASRRPAPCRSARATC